MHRLIRSPCRGRLGHVPASPPRVGESRWPMALAVLTAGALRAALPPQLREGEAPWAFLVVVATLLVVLCVGDPGRVDRQSRLLRIVTGTLIGLISVANAVVGVR